MRTLSRYFLASYLKLFVAILFAALISIAIVEMLLNFDEILDDHAGLGGVASYLFLRLPAYYFRDLIPVTSFAAAFFTIGLAARSHEVMAVKAGGVSPAVMVLPILAAAMLLSTAAFAINETWVLAASRASARSENDGAEVSFRRGSFWYHRGDVIYTILEADASKRTLRGVRVFETTPTGRLKTSTEADYVEIDGDHRWHLHDATIRHFDPDRPTAAPDVRHVVETVLDVAAERDLVLLDASARTLSLPELKEYIRARREDGRDTLRFREMLHARMAEPVTVLAFALLALPLGLAVERRRSVSAAAVLGIVMLGCYYTARTVASVLVDSRVDSAAFAPWLLLGAIIVIGLIGVVRESR